MLRATNSLNLLLLITGVLTGCSTSKVLVPHTVALVQVEQDIPEAQLLDVGVQVFDPGVPEGDVDKEVVEELLDEGIYIYVRRAESIHMAVQLRDALQSSGHWGSVWVTPTESMATDLQVAAEILNSDGHWVRVHVTAVDATGRTWLDKPYQAEIPASIYGERRHSRIDPYQDLFNGIANDLAALRMELPAADTRGIRTTSALRYAAELSPEAFSGYVAEDRKGRHELVRLPAAEDSFFERIGRVRQRERLFFDTLGQHYLGFTSRTADSYARWREHAREDAMEIRNLTRTARLERALGMTAMLASIGSFMGGGTNALSRRFLRESFMFMSGGLLQSSTSRLNDRRLYEAELEDQSARFDDEIAPLVVEIAGAQRRLTGTAEAQYEQWRNLLRRLFVDQTAFEEVSVYADEPKWPDEATRRQPEFQNSPALEPEPSTIGWTSGSVDGRPLKGQPGVEVLQALPDSEKL